MIDRKDTPPRAPTADESTGYAEKQPRDEGDARQPDPKRKPDPEDGGLEREPDTTPGD